MKHRRNRFDLSFPLQTTFDAGVLVPFFVQDTLPNDTFYLSAKSFIRAQPMTAPLLHDVDVFLQYFYCPERILWDKTEDFFLGIPDETGALPVRPTIKAPTTGWKIGSLADYLGFPTGQGEIEHSAIPFRAYAAIYNEFYRDKTMQSPVSISLSSALDDVTNLELQSPRWKKDYFHKSELQRQLGSPVQVPIIQSSGEQSQFYHYHFVVCFASHDAGWTPIGSLLYKDDTYKYSTAGYIAANKPYNASCSSTSATKEQIYGFINQHVGTMEVGKAYLITTENGDKIPAITNQLNGAGGVAGYYAVYLFSKELEAGHNSTAGIVESASSYSPCLEYALDRNRMAVRVSGTIIYHSSSLQTSGVLSIDNLAQATHMQRFQETMLKVDNDYSKFIKAMYGFKINNDTIDLPQYLGGSRGEIAFSAVLQTSEGEQGGVGSMYGHGVGRAKQRPIKFRCPEHGVILGIISIRPKFVYSQGIDRAWSRTNRFDFFLPDFSDIGPQEVMQKELYATKDNKDILFGYSERFAEYRSRFPKISGMFKRELADWNMAMEFASPPSLNADFLSMKGGMDGFKRPFAVPSEHNYLMYIYNKTTAIRAVPKFARRTTL